MKLRYVLGIGTAAYFFVVSPLSAAEPRKLPPAVEERVKELTKACIDEVVNRVTAVELAGGIPRFIVTGPDGIPREVNRLQFIIAGVQVCAVAAAAHDPLVAPHMAPLTPAAGESPL